MPKLSPVEAEIKRLEARLAKERNPSIQKSLRKDIAVLRAKTIAVKGREANARKGKTIPEAVLRQIKILEGHSSSLNRTPAERREYKFRLMSLKEKYGLLKVKSVEVEKPAERVTPVYRITKSNNYKAL